ncbi:MAG TPA: DNA recombination protein RmuC [Solirubrobacterales bacterium]|nr:DNA recombination protein RmuC [Solirubrobacterales bacterium]
MVVLVVVCIVGLCVAVAFAMHEKSAATTAAERNRDLEAELAEAEAGAAEIGELRIEIRGRDEQLTAEKRIATEREAELGRLRGEQGADRKLLGEQSQEIKRLKDAIDGFRNKQEEIAADTLKAAGSNQRIETTLLDWTRQIASPQGRGAFGERALHNQLLSLGLEEGRDFSKQATPEAGGRQRVDFIVRLGDPVVAIDSKLANDPGLAGLSEALATGNPESLKAFGRKLRDHAKALAQRDYWRGLEQSPSLTLMYVPIEGASHALAALDDFDATKFFNTHRVCVVTPSQLPLALILIAEVCHAERKEAHIEELLGRGYTMAEAMSKFLDNYAKLGKKLGESVNAFNSGAAMTTSHGLVWQQVVKPLSELAPSKSIEPGIKELEPPRDDVIDLAERYRETAAEMRDEQGDAADAA